MSFLDRLASSRALRLLLASIAVLCATSAGAATVWHPRRGYAVRAAATRRPEPPRESAAPPATFTLGREGDAKAIQVRVERLLALPSTPSYEAVPLTLAFRGPAVAAVFDVRPASAGGPRAPPRPRTIRLS